jgi:GNAT superfamily N-acetyltransferase
MRKAYKHGQTLTFSPVTDPAALQVGDIVLVNWRGGAPITHLVGAIRDGQFLIINSLGKENGWVAVDAILGYVTQTIEPPVRPTVAAMLDQLESAYHALLARTSLPSEAATSLLSIAADLRWYAALIGLPRWSQSPRLNLWSFEQQLWHLSKEAQASVEDARPDTVRVLLHHGKEHVGQVAMLATLLDATNHALLVTHANGQTSITIRNVIASKDLIPLVNLRNLCAGPGAQPVTLAQQQAKLLEPNQEPATDHWVAEETGDSWTLLGQSFGYHTIPERYLAWLEVHPDWRRRGIGSELLKRVMERAKALGADHILINVDAGEQHSAAHTFLQHHGFAAQSDVWLLQIP